MYSEYLVQVVDLSVSERSELKGNGHRDKMGEQHFLTENPAQHTCERPTGTAVYNVYLVGNVSLCKEYAPYTFTTK